PSRPLTTPPSSSVFWRSPPNAPTAPSSATSPAPKCTRSWPRPTSPTWHGRRDYALLALAGQTGLRVSELTGAKIRDIHLGRGPHACCHGKGRKDRITPLTSHTVTALRAWLTERRGAPNDPLFPSRRGTPLSTDARRTPRRQACRHCCSNLRIPPSQEDHPAYAAPQRCDGPAAFRRRHLRHRALARPRVQRDLDDLPARRHVPQGTGSCPHRATHHDARPIHRTRHRPGLPRQPVIIPSHPAPDLPSPCKRRQLGITRVSG